MNLFEFANARESIRLLREAGIQRPWTMDWRLKRFHFGNIFREDDPTTKWIKQHMIDPVADNPEGLLFAAITARLFGSLPALNLIEGVTDVDEMFEILRPLYHSRRGWKFTSQYQVKVATTRMEATEESLRTAQQWASLYTQSEIDLHKFLCQLPACGHICANEIIADLRSVTSYGPEYVFPYWAVIEGLGMAPKRRHPIHHESPEVLLAVSVLHDTLEQSRSEWRYSDRPWTLTTAARAAALYGRYLREDDPHRRSR